MRHLAVEFPAGIPSGMLPDEALSLLRDFLDTDPEDHTLCAAALTIGEPLIDWHWRAVEEDFVALMKQSQALRKIVSCCAFDESVPEVVQERLYGLVRPEDHIGRQPAEASDGERDVKGLATIDPELALRLQTAPADEVAHIVRTACETAVASSGLALPEASAAFDLLASTSDEPKPSELVERLWQEKERLDAEVGGVTAGPKDPGALQSFFRARACEALRYALDPAVPGFADRAVFFAAFASEDRAKFLSSLRSL